MENYKAQACNSNSCKTTVDAKLRSMRVSERVIKTFNASTNNYFATAKGNRKNCCKLLGFIIRKE